jgi:excisionase family DNA binding protein
LCEIGEGDGIRTLDPNLETADYLGVSRPYLISMLEAGTLPFGKGGTHRRIRFNDVKVFKKIRDRDREAAMQELADQAQELGMGY